jgi:YegS/Rv2252/BmrU family lipid kinase
MRGLGTGKVEKWRPCLPGGIWKRVYLGQRPAEMVMDRNILYIVNPVSGTKSKKDLVQAIEKKTRAKEIPFQVFPSVASGDYSFLRPIIREEKISEIVIAGGDGTIRQVVDNLKDLELPFGIIPCGSGNGLAGTAHIPKNVHQALDLVFEGASKKIDGFYINDHFACMLSGLGFDAKVAYDFAQQPTRGLATYVRQVVKNFFSAGTYPFEILIGNKVVKTDAYFICIANSNQFGNNFTIAPKASLQDGLLDFVIMTSQHKLSVLLQTFRQVIGRNKLIQGGVSGLDAALEKKAGVIYFQAEEITILNPAEAPLHIDGDPAESPAKLLVRVCKKCFSLIQPG